MGGLRGGVDVTAGDPTCDRFRLMRRRQPLTQAPGPTSLNPNPHLACSLLLRDAAERVFWPSLEDEACLICTWRGSFLFAWLTGGGSLPL
jgi:hypothetical protein